MLDGLSIGQLFEIGRNRGHNLPVESQDVAEPRGVVGVELLF
jgi:hypothetical protein